MRVKSRPSSTRTVARNAGKQRKVAPIDLPEDEDDYRPRSRKPRSKEQTKESDAKRREAFEEAEEQANALLEDDASEKKVKSVFKRSFQDIKKKLESDGDIPIEETATAYYRTSLALIQDLMPIAEENYRKTGKEGAAYVINVLINQARDLNNDLKLAEDIEGRLSVIQTLVHSIFVRVAELLLREKYAMHNTIDGVTSNSTLRKALRKELDGMIMSYAKGLSSFENILNMQVRAYLSGDPNYLAAGSERTEEPKKKKGRRKKNG